MSPIPFKHAILKTTAPDSSRQPVFSVSSFKKLKLNWTTLQEKQEVIKLKEMDEQPVIA